MAADQRVVVPGRFGLPEQLPVVREVVIDGVWPTFATTATVELTAVPTREGDVFGGETLTSSATASSIPWGHLAVLAALVALVWIVSSRRRRTRREAAIREQARADAQVERTATTPIVPGTDPKPRTDQPLRCRGDRFRRAAGQYWPAPPSPHPQVWRWCHEGRLPLGRSGFRG